MKWAYWRSFVLVQMCAELEQGAVRVGLHATHTHTHTHTHHDVNTPFRILIFLSFFLSFFRTISLPFFRPLLPSLCFVTSIFSSSLFPFPLSLSAALCLLYVSYQFSPILFHNFTRVRVSFIPVPSCSPFFLLSFSGLRHLLSTSFFPCLCISLSTFLVSDSSLTLLRFHLLSNWSRPYGKWPVFELIASQW